MKSMELLTLQGLLFGASRKRASGRAEELLELVHLGDARQRRVGTYSGGMRRRLNLALALVHEPEILFLDEPTTGLDPAGRRDVWEEVRRLNRTLGMTIFLTTQYLEEADELADVVAIIDRGKLLTIDTPQGLIRGLGAEERVVFEVRGQFDAAVFEALAPVTRVEGSDGQVIVYGRGQGLVGGVVRTLESHQISFENLRTEQADLEDVFLALTGRAFRD